MDFSTHTIKQTMNNDNVVSKRNNNDNVTKADQVDYIADKLVERLDNSISRSYYCRVAWNLSEAKIMNNLEVALKGNNPQRLFTWLCQKDLTNQA